MKKNYTSKTHVVRGTNERICDRIFMQWACVLQEVHDDHYFAASLVKRHPVNSVFLAQASNTVELYKWPSIVVLLVLFLWGTCFGKLWKSARFKSLVFGMWHPNIVIYIYSSDEFSLNIPAFEIWANPLKKSFKKYLNTGGRLLKNYAVRRKNACLGKFPLVFAS